MPVSSLTASPRMDLSPDEHREWVRIDDHLLLEYRLLSDPIDAPAPELPPITPEMIAAAVGKPTADLLARSGDVLSSSPLLPWMMKIDWLLGVMLKAMAAQRPECMDIARMTGVSISGGGIGFMSPRQFAVGDRLWLKIILPPFTPIHTTAQVLRCSQAENGVGFTVGAHYLQLAPDDQDHIIRHVISVQAERLRARRAGA